MTIYYVDSAASNTAPYDTWAKAANSLATIAGIDGAGDTIYVASGHAELVSSASYNWAGTLASPTKIICADKTSGEPPTIAATGGTIVTGGAASGATIFNTGYGYIYGLTFITGVAQAGTCSITLNAAGTSVQCESCSFQLASTGTGSRVSLVGANGGFVLFENCSVKFAATAQKIDVPSIGNVRCTGLSILAGGSAITQLLGAVAQASDILFEDCDFTNGAAAMNLASDLTSNTVVTFRNCSLPSSWSGTLNASTPGIGSVYTLNNCDASGTNYRLIQQNQFGTEVSETTVVRTGGANDGTTPLSWKMSSNSSARVHPDFVLRSPEIVQWNDTTGAAKTVTVEFVHDTNVAAGQGAGAASAFQNDEMWMEVSYLSASGVPLGTLISTQIATPLTAAADITSSSVGWTTTGLTTPVKQKFVTASFTPQMKGFIHAVICIAKASKTIYVDPVITVT